MSLVSVVTALFKPPELYIIELFHAVVDREIKLLVRLAQLPDTYFLREPKMGCFPSLKHVFMAEPFDKKPQEQLARKKCQGVQTRE